MIVNNLSVHLGSKDILKNISFTLSNSDKVGLVGINGAGKSTLLKSLIGDVPCDSGNIKLIDETIGYLKQEIEPKYNELTISNFIKKDVGIDVIEEKLHFLENNLTDDNMNEYSEILNKYLELDGYSFEDNLNNILSGLRLNKSLDNKISCLSGGEKIKVLISSILLKNNDILLLDEPTNNLDIEAIEWLESYLKTSDKKMIIISHDEDFLNNIVDKIFELSDGYLNEYNMSYNLYLEQKDIEYEQLKEKYENAQDQKNKLKKQLQKAKEWANKGNNKKAHNDNDKIANNFAKERTNNSNISKIANELKNLEVPEFSEKKSINVFFNLDNLKGNKNIELDNVVCGYKDFKTPVFNLLIPYGVKINITGANGTGKTTLIKTILGEIDPLSGDIKIGNDARIGYISQNTLEENNDDSIYSYITKKCDDVDKSKIFMLLDKFNINYEDKEKAYASLSPGERTRVNLAKLALDNINVLILDEITNHLDKDALDLIYELVREYEGTIISISHNRRYNSELNPSMTFDVTTGTVIQKEKKLTI